MAESRTTAEFTIVRTFDAPIDLVWSMWIDPTEIAEWWHPRGVSTPRSSVSVDLRVGGRYRYTMVNDATGDEYPTGGEYVEIVPVDLLKFSWGNPDDSVDESPIITLTLLDRGAKTEVTFHLARLDERLADAGVYEGWQSALDVLGDHVGARVTD